MNPFLRITVITWSLHETATESPALINPVEISLIEHTKKDPARSKLKLSSGFEVYVKEPIEFFMQGLDKRDARL